VTHYLVTDATAEELERLTGLRGRDTPLGVLVEKPKPFCLEAELEKLAKLLHPTHCTCGSYAIIHQPNCPMWGIT
jgi:hypothetical protein